MSVRLFVDDVLFRQRSLKAERLYADELDGRRDPLTGAPGTAFEMARARIQQELRGFDMHSESLLGRLLLPAQRVAGAFLGRLRDSGINAGVISGTRSYGVQDALYRFGRWGNPGSAMTDARGGGRSFRRFGEARNVGVFADDGACLMAMQFYQDATHAGLVEGIEWGSDNARFIDLPHDRLTLPWMAAQLRERLQSGLPYVPG